MGSPRFRLSRRNVLKGATAAGNEINCAFAGQISGKEALDNTAEALRGIMDQNGFYSGTPPAEYAAVAPGLYVGEGKDLPF